MIKMDNLLAANATKLLSGYCTLSIYSDAITDPTILLKNATPAANKLIEYPTIVIGVNSLGFLKITQLSIAAQNAKGIANGTAKWFRLFCNGTLNNSPIGIIVGEIGLEVGKSAILFVNGNNIVLNEPKIINSFAIRIAQ